MPNALYKGHSESKEYFDAPCNLVPTPPNHSNVFPPTTVCCNPPIISSNYFTLKCVAKFTTAPNMSYGVL